MKLQTTAIVGMLALLVAQGSAASEASISPERWADYLDFAYVYCSADAQTLEARLKEYGEEAGITLKDYMYGYLGAGSRNASGLGEEKIRRKAIGYLLQYIVTRDPKLIERSGDTIRSLQGSNASHETRYWYHYIEAHRAMEKGNAPEFVRQNLELWRQVIIPMEADFDTFDVLSLSQSANSGFVSALPYLFENISRLVLIRSQEMSMDRDLDPLAAIVRMLQTGRVGAHPDVIPPEASSAPYLDRIVSRLNGPESDNGSLTFTLTLFEASKVHDRARSLLASEGFSSKTMKAMSVASGAYSIALQRAVTAQGKVAVYIRVLRQLGETYAAKQRLDVDPTVESPFSIDGAMGVYEELAQYAKGEGWQAAGYARVGREAYVTAVHTLWEEIQEATLNGADYYLSRSLSKSGGNDEDVRSAAQMHAHYLSFFKRHAGDEESVLVPDSAFFAAYEVAKGYGDAYLRFASAHLTTPEVEMVAQRYMTALKIYPFDRSLWPAMAEAVDRLGRSKDYLGLARPVAERVTRSRHVDNWIENEEPEFATVRTARSALADDLVLMYMGFASRTDIEELEQSLAKLVRERDLVRAQLAALTGDPPSGRGAPPAAMGQGGKIRPLETERKIASTRTQLARLEHRIEARSRALPLYKSLARTDRLIEELRSQRSHPAHTLLRRMYYEKAS